MNKGYCYAYRDAWTHPAFNDLREAAIWNFLYQNAFYEDGERNFNKHTFQLKRGQIVVSYSFLASGFCMTEKGVRVVIQKLEKLGMLGIQGTSKGTILTICNYNEYQLNKKTKGKRSGNQGASKGQAKGNNNNKLSNKVNNEESNNIPPNTHQIEFENLWNEYKPYDMAKGNKKSALKSYLKARKGTDYETVIRGITRYIEYCHSTKCKTKHVSTWINQCGWADEYDIPTFKNEKPSYFDQLASASRAVQNSYQHQDNED